MKILIVSQYFYPENFRINTLSEDLVRRGHNVTVLTAYPQYPKGEIYEGYGFGIPYEKEWNGVKINRVKTYPRGKNAFGLLRNCTSYVFFANKWVRKCDEKFDVVFVLGLSPATIALPGVKYKKKFGTPMFFNLQDLWPESVHEVLGIHFPPLTWVINRVVNKTYKYSDKILCTSNGFVENLRSKGVPAEKLVFWPQFCLEPNFDGVTKPDIYSDDEFNIVFTGNIGDAQGLDLLVEVADKLRDTHVHWYLVGDGRAKERLIAKVKENAIEDRVTFIGRVSEAEANRYVHFADCAYLSFKDNQLFNMMLPAKLQTYLACGTPILAAAGGESAELITEAECGIAATPNTDELTKAVKKILSMSEDERKNMAKNAEKYYKEHFTMDRLVPELEKMMEASMIKE